MGLGVGDGDGVAVGVGVGAANDALKMTANMNIKIGSIRIMLLATKKPHP